MDSRVVGTIVLGLGGLLAAAVLIPLATGSEADYADFVPAPDSIIWQKGQETTLWLSTNRHAVDLHVSSIDLGLGAGFQRFPGSGETFTLSDGLGCLVDVGVVSGLTVDSVGATSVEIDGTIDRGSVTGDVTVHVRRYRTSEGVTSATAGIKTASGTSTAFTYDLSSLSASTEFRVDASVNVHFPPALTRSVTFTTGDAESGTFDAGEEEAHLLENTGISLIACDEGEDVAVTLHGDDGVELNRYLVDIGPAAAAAAAPVPAPVFAPAYDTLRFCPDAASPRDAILTGAEAVGTVTATGTGTRTYSLAPDGDSRDFAFFSIDDSTGEVTVSAAGGDDHTGIDGTRLYTFVIRATDDAGRVGEALVAVQLDLTNLSPGDDGDCS